MRRARLFKHGVQEWPNIVADYRFDETTGDLIDHKNSYNGEVFGSMVRDGESYETNGTNAFVRIDDVDDFSMVDENGDGVDYTISGVIEFPDINADGFVIAKRASGDAKEWQLLMYGTTLNFRLNGDNGNDLGVTINRSNLSSNTKYHFVVVYTDSTKTLEMFFNKSDSLTYDDSDVGFDKPLNTTADVHVGRAGYTEALFLKANFYSLKFIKGKAWTQQDINNDYNATMI